MNLEHIFTKFQSVLQKHRNQLYELLFYPENLGEIKKTIVSNTHTFSYTFSNIKIVIPPKFRPSHCIPSTLENIEITLSIEDEIIVKRLTKHRVEDPLGKLEKFNIILNSDGYSASWHLDRHEKQEGESIAKNVHPIYHLTFGGHYMESQDRDKPNRFGETLIVRAPRIMHPPMELILGLDFIFNHFIPLNELDLLSDRAYLEIISELKSYIWMPYALAFAKNYCSIIDVDGNRLQFDDKFVTSVLNC